MSPMKPSMSSPGEANGRDALEARLRAEAGAARRTAPPGLRERVLAQVHASARPARRRRSATPWLAAAAAAALATFFAARGPEDEVRTSPAALRPGAPTVVALSHEIFDTVARRPETHLDQPFDSRLRAEARNLWLDTSRMVEGVVRGLPPRLRQPLEKL